MLAAARMRAVEEDHSDTASVADSVAESMPGLGPSRRKTSAKVAASLVSCFDFTEPGVVTVDDWDRGTSLLGLEDEDAQLWGKLSGTFGDGDGGIDLARIPLRSAFSDPTLLASVMKGLIHSLATLSSAVEEMRGIPGRVATMEEQSSDM